MIPTSKTKESAMSTEPELIYLTREETIAVEDAAPDFYFVIEKNEEPDQPGQGYYVSRVAYGLAPADDQWPVETVVRTGVVIESMMTDDPGAEIEAFRIFQEFPDMEERDAFYAQRDAFYGVMA